MPSVRSNWVRPMPAAGALLDLEPPAGRSLWSKARKLTGSSVGTAIPIGLDPIQERRRPARPSLSDVLKKQAADLLAETVRSSSASRHCRCARR
jgi:hypothetical protein